MAKHIQSAAILNAIRQAEIEAVEQVAEVIAADARHRAPIRKVFREKTRRRFRPLTPLERNIATRRSEHYYTKIAPNDFKRRRSLAHLRNYAQVQLLKRGSANSLQHSRSLRLLGSINGGRFTSSSGAFPNRRGGFEPGEKLSPLLTARGKYEVRSGRAVHISATKQGQRVQIGGALKASIASEGAQETETGVKAVISARIRYAKYVEFPTVHNAAQPFLRPALHGNRTRLRQALANEIRKALGG